VRADRVGKLFVMMFTNGDLPTNPMCLRECLVCGEVFNRIDSMAHAQMPCPPFPQRPFAIVTRQGKQEQTGRAYVPAPSSCLICGESFAQPPTFPCSRTDAIPRKPNERLLHQLAHHDGNGRATRKV
jgi:hypothetical protein